MAIIGRQHICDAYYKTIGYDIMFRYEDAGVTATDDLSVSAAVLHNIMHDLGLDDVLGEHDGFLKVDCDFLNNDLIHTLPKERFVLMLLEHTLERPNLLQRVAQLHSEGFRFGINDMPLSKISIKSSAPLLPYLEYLKVDALAGQHELLPAIKKICDSASVSLIASKVETLDTFSDYYRQGIEYFQGFYIKQPFVIQSESLEPDQLAVIEIWKMLQEDAEFKAIITAIERHHALALQLMQFINSSYFSFPRQITSITQIVSLLGRKTLSNWLLLLMVSNKEKRGKANHPLLLMVINRTEIMTGLVRLTNPSCSKDDLETAYLVGMLSLIHLLLNIEHRVFLRKLNVSSEIENAMFEATCYWGELLTMTRYIEHTDAESLRTYADKYHIDKDAVNRLIIDAMQRVNAFESMLNQTM